MEEAASRRQVMQPANDALGIKARERALALVGRRTPRAHDGDRPAQTVAEVNAVSPHPTTLSATRSPEPSCPRLSDAPPIGLRAKTRRTGPDQAHTLPKVPALSIAPRPEPMTIP